MAKDSFSQSSLLYNWSKYWGKKATFYNNYKKLPICKLDRIFYKETQCKICRLGFGCFFKNESACMTVNMISERSFWPLKSLLLAIILSPEVSQKNIVIIKIFLLL